MAIYDNTNINVESTCFISNIKAYMDAMKNAARSGTYSSSNVPRISGSVKYNPSSTNATQYTAVSNPAAVITSDLESFNVVNNITSTPQEIDQTMDATTILNAFRSLVTNMSRVHNFSSTWNHTSSSGNYLVGSTSGKALFKTGLSNGTSGSTTANRASTKYTRTVPGTFYANTNTSYDSLVAKDNIISAGNMKNLMQTLYNNWLNNINNKFTYQIWTCHYNCHSNCHSSGRGRR